MKPLVGKSALITGAARGIGRAFAEAYVAEGATVAIADIDVAGADGEHWDGVDAKFAAAEGLAPGEKKRQVGATVPIGRMATAEDFSGMAVFLASKEADYIVAQTYNVDGGNWMS